MSIFSEPLHLRHILHHIEVLTILFNKFWVMELLLRYHVRDSIDVDRARLLVSSFERAFSAEHMHVEL